MMPNWCNNTLTLRHDDPAMIKRAADAIKADNFLNEFVPIPEALKETVSPAPEGAKSVVYNGTEYTDWYSFCVNEWGTKWEITAYGEPDVSDDGLTLETSFDSAWAPPVEAYRKLEDLGFTVEALYYEPGVGFCGEYIDGSDDTYEIPGTSEEVDDVIPHHINDAFAIAENMSTWEEESIDFDAE